MSNLPPDWSWYAAEPREHLSECATNCPFAYVEPDDYATECQYGHIDHKCDCDEIRVSDAEAARVL
jgi:hypothetical protein